MSCGTQQVIAVLRAAAEVMVEHRDELVELDRLIGDGDHGENMRRGFLAFVAAVDLAGPRTPAAVLKLLATTLIATVGGAAGPLYGTGFLRVASVLGDAAELTPELAAAALKAALNGVVARGRAKLGDKTIVDALVPAVDAAAATVGEGASVSVVLAAAAEAAHRGAESTIPLVARKGRASYLGERSAGHLDPGARSTALLLRAIADAAARS